MNYYEVLGVQPGASDAEIKKKYHKLAKEYHPDKANGDEEKEKQFLKIQEAYSSLTNKDGMFRGFDGYSDDVIFQQFSDMFGFEFPSTGMNQATDVDNEYEVQISIEEYLNGASKPIQVSTTSTCDSCSGTGIRDHQVNTRVCAAGHGTGFDSAIPIFTCSVCRGKRFVVTNHIRCNRCEGEGFLIQYEDIAITIPRLTRQGHIIVKEGFKFKINHAFSNAIDNGRVIIIQDVSILKWLCGGDIMVKIHDGERIAFRSTGAFDLGRRYKVSKDVLVEFKLVINSKHTNMLRQLNPVFKNIFQRNT